MNKMLVVRWLPPQQSHAFNDVSTLVFDLALVIVIPFHFLECVQFPLPESQIIWHASHEILDAIPVVGAWTTQSRVSFLQHVVIVRLHALILDPTLDILLLFTRRKWVVGMVL